MIRERVNALQEVVLDMKTELAALNEEERLHKAHPDEGTQGDQAVPAETEVKESTPYIM